MPAWGAIHAPQENRFIIGPTKTSRPERLANNLLIPFTTAISAERPFPKQFVPCPTSVYQSHRGERKRSNRSRPHHHTPNFKVLRAKVQQFFFLRQLPLRASCPVLDPTSSLPVSNASNAVETGSLEPPGPSLSPARPCCSCSERSASVCLSLLFLRPHH